MVEKMFTSRTAVLAFKTCPYKRLLQYHMHGSGLVPCAESLDLLNGTVIHRGLQHLLEHCRVEHPDGNFEEACVDEAVEKAREVWKEALNKRGLALKTSAEYDRIDWIIAEQECVWEGLIRAFAIRRLPFLLEEYEILEVEHEEVSKTFSPCEHCEGVGWNKFDFPLNNEEEIAWAQEQLAGYYCGENNIIRCIFCHGTGCEVIFLGKADGLFRRKSDGAIIILSIKSTSEYADVTERDILHDMQGVSEWFLVQERLDKAYDKALEYKNNSTDMTQEELEFIKQYSWFTDERPKVFAVQYEYLIKGKRQQEPYRSGIYKQQSFLCHPLKLERGMPQMQWGGSAVINPDEFKWKIKAGNPGKGWGKCDIWNEMEIKDWINMLATGNIQPEEGHPFDQILRTPDLVDRNEREIAEWRISTSYQEEQIAKHIREIQQFQDLPQHDYLDNDEREQAELELIWQYFPKNTLSCHNYYGHDCEFVKHCHELESIEDLRNGGYLVPRKSHHEDERLYQIQKGWVEKDE